MIETVQETPDQENTPEDLRSGDALVKAGSLGEAEQLLDETNFFCQGNVLIVDLDETLRPSFDHGLTLSLGKLPQESQELLTRAKNEGVHVAVVTNQPREGHQISRTLSKIRDYEASFSFFEENDIPVFGYEAEGLGPIEAVKYLTSLARRDLYKNTEEAVSEVGDWINRQQNPPETPQIVWIGNNQRDVDFGKRLRESLKQGDSTENITIIQLPDFRSKSMQGFN
jgi:hypothetical protein